MAAPFLLRRCILATKILKNLKNKNAYLYKARVILDALIMPTQLILINNVIIIERLDNQPKITS